LPGQTKQWATHHRKVCKRYNQFTTTPEYQVLQAEQRTDVTLLSELLVNIFPKDDYDTAAAAGRENGVAQFFDLLKGPVRAREFQLPPLCGPAVPSNVAQEVFARFGNNNFLLHSHLISYAHGIFPLASRLLNHSCVPNCAVKYIISSSEMVRMQIVSLRDIAGGEQVSLAVVNRCSLESQRMCTS
jgi:hypothetical protein